MSILNILNQLAATSKGTEKLAILQANRDNQDLKQFFYLALDPLVTFGIKKIPKYEFDGAINYLPLEDAMEMLGVLTSRDKTGNEGIAHLASVLSRVSPDDAEAIIRIIEKDPKCGVAGSTANKVWKDLIFDFPVMKASPHDEKSFNNITFPAYSQTKLDGARCAIVVGTTGIVTALSSSGREILTHGLFDWFGEFKDMVFDGELLYVDETGNFVDRKTGNGIVNRAVKGTIPVNQAKGLHFVCFDAIPRVEWANGRCDTPYSERMKKCAAVAFRHNASFVDTKIINSEAEAMKHFREMLAKGLEGTIVKDMNSIWEGKRRKDHIKLKGIITCDLKVIATEEGTGKNVGKLGALVCSSGDGELIVNVGTGFSDAERSLDRNSWVGKIVEVAYNERIINKAEGSKWALFLPRFLQVRVDKVTPDNLDNIPLKA